MVQPQKSATVLAHVPGYGKDDETESEDTSTIASPMFRRSNSLASEGSSAVPWRSSFATGELTLVRDHDLDSTGGTDSERQIVSPKTSSTPKTSDFTTNSSKSIKPLSLPDSIQSGRSHGSVKPKPKGSMLAGVLNNAAKVVSGTLADEKPAVTTKTPDSHQTDQQKTHSNMLRESSGIADIRSKRDIVPAQLETITTPAAVPAPRTDHDMCRPSSTQTGLPARTKPVQRVSVSTSTQDRNSAVPSESTKQRQTAGHVFVVLGDLTSVLCDCWLVPTDNSGVVEKYWRLGLTQLEGLPENWGSNDTEERVYQWEPITGLRPARWPVNVGGEERKTQPLGWYLKGVQQFLAQVNERLIHASGRKMSSFAAAGPKYSRDVAEKAAKPLNGDDLIRAALADEVSLHEQIERWEIRQHREHFQSGRKKRESTSSSGTHNDVGTTTDQLDDLIGYRPVGGRQRPLICVPVIGTGRGGFHHKIGDILRGIFPILFHAARTYKFDVALVTNRQRMYVAAVSARHDIPGRWNALPDRLREHARALAELAVKGDLVLFVGAGVSKGAGLPDWKRLLMELADILGLDEGTKKALRFIDPLDAATYLKAHQDKDQLALMVSELLRSPYYAISHALLASLPVQNYVTTNYDQLMENALNSTYPKQEFSVLPHDPLFDTDRSLLKLHGCVTRPESIVLTREDYLRYSDSRAALAGIMQSLLLTKYVLFVGFSLSDANFHAIMDKCRRAMVRSTQADSRGFGTALDLRENRLNSVLWKDDITWVPMSHSSDLQSEGFDAELEGPGRVLEIFLDYLSARACRSIPYILSNSYTGMLRPHERPIRMVLRRFIDDLNTLPDESKKSYAYEKILELLNHLGLDQDENYDRLLPSAAVPHQHFSAAITRSPRPHANAVIDHLVMAERVGAPGRTDGSSASRVRHNSYSSASSKVSYGGANGNDNDGVSTPRREKRRFRGHGDDTSSEVMRGSAPCGGGDPRAQSAHVLGESFSAYIDRGEDKHMRSSVPPSVHFVVPAADDDQLAHEQEALGGKKPAAPEQATNGGIPLPDAAPMEAVSVPDISMHHEAGAPAVQFIFHDRLENHAATGTVGLPQDDQNPSPGAEKPFTRS
eukprot:Clim_evm11s249 gene=Clim_evmTU11s249